MVKFKPISPPEFISIISIIFYFNLLSNSSWLLKINFNSFGPAIIKPFILV